MAIDDEGMRKTHVQFWDDVYGFKMGCMKTDVIREASVEIVKPNTVISESCVLKVRFHLSFNSFYHSLHS